MSGEKSSQRRDKEDPRFRFIISFINFLCFLFFLPFLTSFDSLFNFLSLSSCLPLSPPFPHILPFISYLLLQVSLLHFLLSRFLVLFSLPYPPSFCSTSSHLFPSIDSAHLPHICSLLFLLSRLFFLLFFLSLILPFPHPPLSPSYFSASGWPETIVSPVLKPFP